ncbi:MAG: hypothetical protein IJY62_05300 [Clostridia bacterium]|nr:hypothetical protein [Clostridia bacterium]
MKKCKKGIICSLLSALMAVSIVGAVGFAEQTASASAVEIDPIAKYEFKDSTNFGKDSMGNYDMEYRNAYVAGGSGELLNSATAIEGGGVSFSGGFCVAQDAESNMFADVTAFTLCFEIMTAKGTAEWEHYIGVGNSSDYFSFIGRMPSYPGQLRLYTYNMTKNNDYYSAPKVFEYGANKAPTDFEKIIVSVQPGGNMTVYRNGTAVALTNPNASNAAWDTSIDSTWATATGKSFFSIGGRYNGAADKLSTGSIRNVAFYDFAMDETCVTAYNTNGKVTTDDIANLTYITDANVGFEGEATSQTLDTSMTEEAMLAAMNEGTVTLTLSNSTTVEAPITWTGIEQENDKYYAKGSFETSKLGYANTFGNEIAYELTVVELSAVMKMSISAADDFGLNYYVKLPAGTTGAKATLAMADKETETVSGVYDEGEGLWRFTYPVAAKDYDKAVTLTVVEVDGEAVENGATASYSVKDYANAIEAGDYAQGVKELLASLVAYCEATQDYFGNAVVEKVTENVITAEELAQYKGSATGAQAGVELLGATLILESKTTICVYFKAESVDGFNCSGTPVCVDEANKIWVIEVQVVARDLSTVQTVTIGGITVKYSAISYIETVLSQGTENAALYNVVQAIYSYSAKADEVLG